MEGGTFSISRSEGLIGNLLSVYLCSVLWELLKEEELNFGVGIT